MTPGSRLQETPFACSCPIDCCWCRYLRTACCLHREVSIVANDPIRVGVLFSTSGVTSTIGRSQLAESMTANFGARVYRVGSDYIFPYESNRIMGELVLQRQNSDKVGERYVPLNATQAHFKPIFDDIRDKQPDFIFSTVVGDS